MIEYTWNIAQMDAYPEYAGNTEVVFNVHWTLSGSDGVCVGSTYGAQVVTIDPEATFVPYEELTLQQVIEWVQTAMGPNQVAAVEQKIANQIENQINPPVLYPPLPWAQT